MSVTAPRFRAIWLISILALTTVLLVALASACGGDDNESSNSSATATKEAAGGSSSTSKATPTKEASSSGSVEDALKELQSLGGDISKVTGKVTYTSTDTDGKTSTMTFYSKSGKSRLDTTDSDGATTTIIETADTSIVCDPSSQTCISYGAGGTGSLGLGFLTLFSGSYVDQLVAAAEAQGISVDKSSEKIAGVDATCFSGTESGGSGKFCFSDSGLMVYEEFGDSSGTTKLEATEVSTDVSDSDFDPPYPVTTIPGG